MILSHSLWILTLLQSFYFSMAALLSPLIQPRPPTRFTAVRPHNTFKTRPIRPVAIQNPNEPVSRRNVRKPKTYAPTLSDSDYSGMMQLSNGGYFYAIDAKHTGTHSGYPGYLRLSNKKYKTIQVTKENYVSRLTNSWTDACDSIEKLLKVDGILPVTELGAGELKSPKMHYIAVAVRYRTINGVRFPGRRYPIWFLRLNEDGTWSYKDDLKPPVILNPIENPDPEKIKHILLSQLPSDQLPAFCGFYVMSPAASKYLLQLKSRGNQTIDTL